MGEASLICISDLMICYLFINSNQSKLFIDYTCTATLIFALMLSFINVTFHHHTGSPGICT